MDDFKAGQDTLERITRKWWFFLLFILLILIVPPYASKGYKFPDEWLVVTFEALGHSIVLRALSPWYAIFNITLIVLVSLVILLPKRFTRIFAGYAAVIYALDALGSIGATQKYGVAICTINLILFAVVAAAWAWDAYAAKNDFTPVKLPAWRYWVVPLALLAFWYPIDLRTGEADFSPIHILTSPGGLAFCLVTPVYAGLLTLYYPKINVVTLRLTSLVGVFIGLVSMGLNPLWKAGTNWWNGVLHLPLLVISVYGLGLSLKQTKGQLR